MKVWILVVAAVVTASGGCRTAPILNPVSAPLAAAPGARVTMEDVSKAVWTAGKKLGWAIQENRPGEMTGTLSIRKHVAVVTITYDTSTFTINYKSSQNLLYQGHEIHRQYNNWVRNLARAIQAEMARAGVSP
jgi:hypothetical protein